MKKRTVYYIRTGITDDQHAGQKARRDIEILADRCGFRGIVFQGDLNSDGSVLSKAGLMLSAIRNWARLFGTERGSAFLIQYPHRPLKTAVFARFMMQLLRTVKKCKFIALVHDLDSLRGMNGNAAVYSDRHFLPAFDRIICHNRRMKDYLIGTGIPEGKLIVLGLFDYLRADEKNVPAAEDRSVCIAGNLSPAQSGYVYKLIDDPSRDFPLHLYGTGFCYDGQLPEDVLYHGSVDPDELPSVLEGAYGLVWGGESAESCTGSFGNYLKYNNPHKLSLFLAAGKPVIIWSEAACAETVTKEHIGIAVADTAEISGRLKNADALADPEALRRFQNYVTNGAFFKRAIRESLKSDRQRKS